MANVFQENFGDHADADIKSLNDASWMHTDWTVESGDAANVKSYRSACRIMADGTSNEIKSGNITGTIGSSGSLYFKIKTARVSPAAQGEGTLAPVVGLYLRSSANVGVGIYQRSGYLKLKLNAAVTTMYSYTPPQSAVGNGFEGTLDRYVMKWDASGLDGGTDVLKLYRINAANEAVLFYTADSAHAGNIPNLAEDAAYLVFNAKNTILAPAWLDWVVVSDDPDEVYDHTVTPPSLTGATAPIFDPTVHKEMMSTAAYVDPRSSAITIVESGSGSVSVAPEAGIGKGDGAGVVIDCPASSTAYMKIPVDFTGEAADVGVPRGVRMWFKLDKTSTQKTTAGKAYYDSAGFGLLGLWSDSYDSGAMLAHTRLRGDDYDYTVEVRDETRLVLNVNGHGAGDDGDNTYLYDVPTSGNPQYSPAGLGEQWYWIEITACRYGSISFPSIQVRMGDDHGLFYVWGTTEKNAARICGINLGADMGATYVPSHVLIGASNTAADAAIKFTIGSFEVLSGTTRGRWSKYFAGFPGMEWKDAMVDLAFDTWPGSAGALPAHNWRQSIYPSSIATINAVAAPDKLGYFALNCDVLDTAINTYGVSSFAPFADVATKSLRFYMFVPTIANGGLTLDRDEDDTPAYAVQDGWEDQVKESTGMSLTSELPALPGKPNYHSHTQLVSYLDSRLKLRAAFKAIQDEVTYLPMSGTVQAVSSATLMQFTAKLADPESNTYGHDMYYGGYVYLSVGATDGAETASSNYLADTWLRFTVAPIGGAEDTTYLRIVAGSAVRRYGGADPVADATLTLQDYNNWLGRDGAGLLATESVEIVSVVRYSHQHDGSGNDLWLPDYITVQRGRWYRVEKQLYRDTADDSGHVLLRAYDTVAETMSAEVLTSVAAGQFADYIKTVEMWARSTLANSGEILLTGFAYRDGDWIGGDTEFEALTAGTLPTPTFLPVAGPVEIGTEVTPQCSEDGVTFRYTDDGSDPTGASPILAGAYTVSAGVDLKVIAEKAGWTTSEVGSAAYTVIDDSGGIMPMQFTSRARHNRTRGR